MRKTIDNNQFENSHATSSPFHRSKTQMENAMTEKMTDATSDKVVVYEKVVFCLNFCMGAQSE